MDNIQLFRTSDSRGIALVEILIAMLVLAVGVMALSRMQGDFIGTTSGNKARKEAVAIAQSRLEDMRNYMHAAKTEAEFNALYAVAADANSVTVHGINSAFTRSETIVANGDLRTVEVMVAWVDMAGENQSVTLNTELMYSDPSGPAAMTMELAGPLIDPPTGRARLGDGTLPEGAETSSNNDGTALYDPGNGNLQLAVGTQIVLTLEDACNLEGGGCTDFVRISGTVYIDKASKNAKPGEVYVLASDAAYCTRYYIDDNDDYQLVENDTDSAATTANGDYEYFDYTCYLGGGWHGNIGILLDGGIAQTDKVCQGDPVSGNDWETPVIAQRRAYRGMIYALDENNQPVKDDQDAIVYWSHGIADATQLPDPDSGDHSHDFVISEMSSTKTEGSNCVSEDVMVRADANIDGAAGDRFKGNPTDFFCLNDGLLDDYENTWGSRSTCPFDPTSPPTLHHIVSGQLSFEADQTAENDALVENKAMGMLTSDGPGNCLLDILEHVDGAYKASYACDVYDWGLGWSGTLEATLDTADKVLSCVPAQISLAAITGDDAGNDITCSIGDINKANIATIAGKVVDDGGTGAVLGIVEISDGGSCTVTDGGLSYSCETDVYVDSWSGTIVYTLTNKYLCSGNAAIAQGSISLAGGSGSGTAYIEEIIDANELNITIAKHSGKCP